MKLSLPKSPGVRRALWLVPLIVVLLVICIDKVVMPLFIGTGDTVRVPNAVGLQRSQAEDLLASQGLIVESVTEQFNASVEKGSVISQLPYANSLVKVGRRMYLTVSKGEAVTRMPDLTFLTQRDAQLALIRVGLQVGTLSWEFKDSVNENVVLRQSVPPGAAIRGGIVVDLVLSKDSSLVVTVPSLVGLSFGDAIGVLENLQLQQGNVTRKPHETYTPGTVIRQLPESGTSLRPSSTVDLWIAE